MFQFFRINDPYRLIFVFLFLIIIRSSLGIMGIQLSMIELKSLILGERLADGFLMYRDAYDTTSPFSAMVYKYVDLLFGKSRFAHQVISTFWIFINAGLFNHILIKSKAYSENNYLPALFFIMFSFIVPDYMALTPQVMSTTFILLALNSVIRRIENIVTDDLFLFAGIYLGIAMLFYIPSIVFFFVFLLSFILFSTPIRRRVLLYFYGFIVPLIMAGCYYYWFDAQIYLINSVLLSRILDDRIVYLNLKQWLPFGIIIGGWLLIALYYTFIKGRHTNFESKISQVMFLYLIAGVSTIWFDNILSPSQLVIFIPPLAFYLTHLVLLIKRGIHKLVLSFLIITSFVVAPFYLYSMLDKSELVVPKNDLPYVNKKIMLLSDELALLNEQRIAGPVISSELSKRNLKGIDKYQEAANFYEAVANNLPEIIIDDWKIMDKIFFRFPLLEEKYRRGINNRYYLKTNN